MNSTSSQYDPSVSLYKLVDDSASASSNAINVSPQVKYGTEFAEVIQAISHGQNVYNNLSKVTYPPFKSLYWNETRYNPALKNTHISHEFDSQYNEMRKYWAKCGKKFSNEPRICTAMDDNNEKNRTQHQQGPLKRDSYEKFYELPVKVFGRTRVIRPFSRAAKGGSFVCVKPHRPTKDEETAHLGPGAYDPYTDKWVESKKPICGVVRESYVFLSSDRFSDVNKSNNSDFDGCTYDVNESTTSTRTISQQSRQNATRPLTSADATSIPTFFKHPPMKIKDIPQVSASYNSSNRLSSSSPTAQLDSPSMTHQKQQQHHNRSKAGFTFPKGKLPPSALDTVTGSTNADIHYRRVLTRDGAEVIMPVSNNNKVLPIGATYVSGWSTTQVYAESDRNLQCISSPIRTTRATTSSSYVKRMDDSTYNLDQSANNSATDSVSHASISLPNSTSFGYNGDSLEWKTPMTLNRNKMNNTSSYTSTDNRVSSANSDTQHIVPVRLAESAPIARTAPRTSSKLHRSVSTASAVNRSSKGSAFVREVSIGNDNKQLSDKSKSLLSLHFADEIVA